jgi:hypothetical protein
VRNTEAIFSGPSATVVIRLPYRMPGGKTNRENTGEKQWSGDTHVPMLYVLLT